MRHSYILHYINLVASTGNFHLTCNNNMKIIEQNNISLHPSRDCHIFNLEFSIIIYILIVDYLHELFFFILF